MRFISLMKDAVHEYLRKEKDTDSTIFSASFPPLGSPHRSRSGSLFSTPDAAGDTGIERARLIWSKLIDLEKELKKFHSVEYLILEFTSFSHPILSPSTKLRQKIEHATSIYQHELCDIRHKEQIAFLEELLNLPELKRADFMTTVEQSITDNLARYISAFALTFIADRALYLDRILFNNMTKYMDLAVYSRFLSETSKTILPKFRVYITPESMEKSAQHKSHLYLPNKETTLAFFSELMIIHCMLHNPYPHENRGGVRHFMGK